MKSPNKFLLIVISLCLSMGLFTFVQYNTNQIISKSMDQIRECQCEEKD